MKQKEMARMGGLARWANTTPKERKKIMTEIGKKGGRPKKKKLSELFYPYA